MSVIFWMPKILTMIGKDGMVAREAGYAMDIT